MAQRFNDFNTDGLIKKKHNFVINKVRSESERITMKLWEWLSDYKFGIFNHYWWSDLWYKQFSSRWRPRNKWITSKIPRTWCDKDTILEICVLESLKHYVDLDGEDCMNVIDTECEHQREFYAEVKRNYELITQKLPALQKEMDVEWDRIHKLNNGDEMTYEEKYGESDRLEKEIYNLQTEIMVWIVKNRNGLWT